MSKNKVPKIPLTPEEKKARKAEKKAEKKRLEAERQKQLKYDHLGREIKYGELTVKRHEKNWRQMLLNIALPRMKTELEYAWHNFERVVDAKDFTISILMDEIKEAEEQYMRNMRSHIDNIDRLIILCYDQIAELRNESKKVILNLYNAATFERTDIIGITKENEEYLKTMLYMLENAKKESEKLIRGEYLSKQEVEISKLNDICSKFTEELEAKFDKMWKDAHGFLKKHVSRCAVRRREYFGLKDQDEIMQKLIKKLWEKIHKHLDTIKLLKHKLNALQLQQSQKISDLTNERNHFDGVYNVVKARLEDERLMDEKNLTLLTLQSNETMKFLEEIEKKGEKILKLSAICRKYETLEEKTMSFPLYSDKAMLKKPESILTISGDVLELQELKPELELFWNRMAQADALRYKMNEECEYLKLQNQQLKRQIHEYCQCLNCHADTQIIYPPEIKTSCYK